VEVVAAALGDGYVKQDRVGSLGQEPPVADGGYQAAWGRVKSAANALTGPSELASKLRWHPAS
jgi:hypothetical protein